MTYEIMVGFDEITVLGLPIGQQYTYGVQVDGQIVFVNTITITNGLDNTINKIGLILNDASPVIILSVSFQRSTTVTQNFRLNLDLLQFNVIFDTTNGCCAYTCPPQTGINLNSDPPSCVGCNAQIGQYYNSTLSQCQCLSGYYLVPGTSQTCSPCTVSLCAQCDPSGPYRCLTCVSGATLSTLYANCTCNSGSLATNGACTSCNYTCASCFASNQCNSCADPNYRNLSNNCNCISGYYDNSSPNCVICPSTCQTCSSQNVCTSCFPNTNTTLNVNG